jgi:hypothetical protein
MTEFQFWRPLTDIELFDIIDRAMQRLKDAEPALARKDLVAIMNARADMRVIAEARREFARRHPRVVATVKRRYEAQQRKRDART